MTSEGHQMVSLSREALLLVERLFPQASVEIALYLAAECGPSIPGVVPGDAEWAR